MKLMHFNDFRLGVLKGDQVVDVTSVVANIPHVGPGDRMNSLIAHFGISVPAWKPLRPLAPACPWVRCASAHPCQSPPTSSAWR